MASPSHPKTLPSLHGFSMKSPSSSSSPLISPKIKTLVQTFILSHLYRVARALTKAKSLVIEVLKDVQLLQFIELTMKKSKNKNKLFLGSFRMHYNWCSSHVMPVPMPGPEGYSGNHFYYDSCWNTVMVSKDYDQDMEDQSQLSGYLQWLEQKAHHDQEPTTAQTNDIDRLADMFIANSHEKFRLEKQESYRKFQEMMARSV